MSDRTEDRVEAGEGAPLLGLEEITKSYVHQGNLIEVLKGLSFTLHVGETVAVVGASGVGKSTLLHVMGSLDPPTEGRVLFEGRDIYAMDRLTLSRFRNHTIGFVFQFHHLLPELSALENAMLPALISRAPRAEAETGAREILGKVGLGARLAHRAGELSGGEQQRVAIARALVMRPKLLLADEPTGNLDWATGQEVVELLQFLNREQGTAMVIATHNLKLAEQMTRQMEIAGGKIR